MKLHRDNPGKRAEVSAETFLIAQGLKLVARNYHCRMGEVDLIMEDNRTLVFIEVRLRSNSTFGNAAYSITPAKQRKLVQTAQHYIQAYAIDQPCRFDAILFSQTQCNNLQWIRNAFEA